MTSFARVMCLLFAAASLLSAGCGQPRDVRAARIAEARGDEHMAYDHYRRAGVRRPGSVTVADGLKRTASSAAAYWESAAGRAYENGEYDQAWIMLMRCLRIQPDRGSALDLLRRIEQTHGDAIAVAKSNYLRRGPSALAVSGVPDEDDEAPEALVQATPQDEAGPIPPPTARATPRADRPDYRTTDTTASNRDFSKPASEPSRLAPEQAPPAKAMPMTPVGLVASGPLPSSQRPRPATKPSRDWPRPRSPEVARRPEPLGSRRAALLPPEKQLPPNREAPERGDGPLTEEDVRIYTLSEDLDQHPESLVLSEGLVIKLKDTDDDPLQADFDVFVHGKRIAKIRKLGVGRAYYFRRDGGRAYRLTIVAVHHDSDTVRIALARLG